MGLWDWLRKAGARASAEEAAPHALTRRIYAVGDIHGRADCLQQMFSMIDRDAGDVPRLEVYLGDYVDRGPQSAQVIDALIGRATRTPLIALLGNHEAMLIQAFQTPEVLMDWGRHGLATTFRSYGLLLMNEDAEACQRSMAELDAAMPVTHRLWLQSLSLMHQEAGFAFVHAGIRPDVALEEQDPRDLLWIREGFLTSKASFGAVVVHGHTPVLKAEDHGNRINIDTGAFATSNLTCLVIDGGPHRFLSTLA